MALATVTCRAQQGIEAPEVNVEVHVGGGLPAVCVVGLPEKAVKESKDRVYAALANGNFDIPQSKVTISLAPADLPKEGGRYDLPIALGLLAATRQIPPRRLTDHVFIGELALSGALRPVRGVLPVALACRDARQMLIVPAANLDEAALVAQHSVRGAADLCELVEFLRTGSGLATPAQRQQTDTAAIADLADVRGQHQARRALEIAAAGSHNLLFYGSPGSGKTMLATRLPGILPPMNEAEARESAAVASISNGGFDPRRWRQRPCRAPHHTASAVAMVGGGSNPRPGEISLAHHGVLFLDEFPEFDRRVLEVLREPMESGRIAIARVAGRAEFPARFQLVAAMNPCPCGYHGVAGNRCRCSPGQVARYQRKISGPLVDRIDLHVEVSAVPPSELSGLRDGESSVAVRERVNDARMRQLGRQDCVNAELLGPALQRFAALGTAQLRQLEKACQRLGLSARAYHRVQRIARTIADLAGESSISDAHLFEALQYRRLDGRGMSAGRGAVAMLAAGAKRR